MLKVLLSLEGLDGVQREIAEGIKVISCQGKFGNFVCHKLGGTEQFLGCIQNHKFFLGIAKYTTKITLYTHTYNKKNYPIYLIV